MAGNRQARRRDRHHQKVRQRPISPQERLLLNRHMRQIYIWRYSVEESAQARQAAGLPPGSDEHGYNMLSLARPEKVDAAYALAKATPQHWQVIQIAYCRDAEGRDFRLWAWLKSQAPIVAAGDGILPLLHESHQHCMADLREEEGEVCIARGVIMAPWDARHPIRPETLTARLKTKLHLTEHEVLSLKEWGDPVTSRVSEADTLDLQLASALSAGAGKE